MKKERLFKVIFATAALFSVVAVGVISIFLFASAIPTIAEIGPLKFLLGTTWKPGSNLYGILPMILGSIVVTLISIIIGVPLGIATALYLTFFASNKVKKVMNPSVELLAGIPSVIYGFFGLVVMVPAIREFGKTLRQAGILHKGGDGNSILTASLLLGMMILPTIIGVTESNIRAVPSQYYEGSLALGATHEQSIFKVVLPAAKSGVIAGVVLGIGRAIGETMAVIMIAGNQARLPESIFEGVRTMTANIVLEMGYASGLHREALIATGVVLFVFILIINFSVALLNRRGENE